MIELINRLIGMLKVDDNRPFDDELSTSIDSRLRSCNSSVYIDPDGNAFMNPYHKETIDAVKKHISKLRG